MASTFKPLYGSYAGLVITSLNSLANNAFAGSATVNNSSALAEDAEVTVKVSTPSSGVTSTGAVYVYAYGSLDNTTFTDGMTGADAVQTPTLGAGNSAVNLFLLGVIATPAPSTTYARGPWSVARAFGGTLPPYWGIVVQNASGAALPASGHAAGYVAVNGQSTP